MSLHGYPDCFSLKGSGIYVRNIIKSFIIDRLGPERSNFKPVQGPKLQPIILLAMKFIVSVKESVVIIVSPGGIPLI